MEVKSKEGGKDVSKKRIVIIGLVLLLAGGASAGELKVHMWPVKCVPQPVCQIKVLLDVGYWIRISCEDLKLQQVGVRTYEGCRDLRVECNFPAQLGCFITPTGVVPGDYSCTLVPNTVDPPGAPPSQKPRLCVHLDNADITGVPGGAHDVHVATVTITVIPRCY